MREPRACAAERAFSQRSVPIATAPVAALASLAGETLCLRAELIAEDGSAVVTGSVEGTIGDACGRALAADLLERAPPDIRRLFAPDPAP